MTRKQMNISDEERERRRQNALALTAEGRIGPQFGKLGGRPRKPRASEMIAEKVASDADEIYKKLIDILRTGKEGAAIKAIQTMLQVEEKERRAQVEEVRDLEKAKRDELLEIVATGLRELASEGIVIDGWAVEITDAELERVSEGDASLEETG